MDKAQARQFRNRWQAVEEIERQEMRDATLELRWQQLNAAYRLSKNLALVPDPLDEMRGYEQWAKLKKIAGRPNKA